ncbi:endolytic transglycosylase MltG [Bacillus suaedae]|uniref:Endolytic murein transglycosylase n=1 Tax=Halalkalibacter suaedae TaxID=2822140 RepID=A0A941AP20_9BACI|nr:endolytic transglycosylase MltG [Bacillus suaedae]MBP3951371.1 endolytic transglycosylase MltG [Bacillus suaedae]
MSNSNEKPRSLYDKRVSQARIVRRVVFFCVLGLLIVGTILGISSYYYLKNALGPIDEESPEEIQVTIPIGSTANQIGTILEEEGLVRNGTLFRYYVRYKNESGFQAGEYNLSTSMTLDELISELKEGRVLEEPELVFTIPEGRWLEDVAVMIANSTGHAVEDIQAVLSDREYVEALIDQYPMLTEEILNESIRHPLEGYVFPAQYEFMVEDPSIKDIIEAMLNRTQTVVDELSSEIAESGYTIHEILTLASIIEREAKTSEDRYKISGVLHDRLESDMPLQVDPTVAYAIGEHRYMTSLTDLKIDSPYNTYRYKGIPVGPIANPGKDSIQAAVRPERTGALFFYARVNGEVIYSETYEEHNRVHQQYRQEWIDAESQGELEEEQENE